MGYRNIHKRDVSEEIRAQLEEIVRQRIHAKAKLKVDKITFGRIRIYGDSYIVHAKVVRTIDGKTTSTWKPHIVKL